MALARRILMADVTLVTLLPQDVNTKRAYETDAMTWMKLVWYFNRAREESQRKSELTKHNWTQHRAAIEAGQVVTPVRPFWLDLLDAEGQWSRWRRRGPGRARPRPGAGPGGRRRHGGW
jgi:hypothetical protein